MLTTPKLKDDSPLDIKEITHQRSKKQMALSLQLCSPPKLFSWKIRRLTNGVNAVNYRHQYPKQSSLPVTNKKSIS